MIDHSINPSIPTSTSQTNPSSTTSPNSNTEEAEAKKLNKEDIKLSPIRKKSASSSSICDEVSSNTTLVENGDSSSNDDNKENSEVITSSTTNHPVAQVVTQSAQETASIKKAKKLPHVLTKSSLIAKLISGYVNQKNKKLKIKEVPTVKKIEEEEEDEDDEETEEEEDDDDEDEDEDVDEDYNQDDDDDDEEEEGEEDDDDDDEEDDDEEEEDDDQEDYNIETYSDSKPAYGSGCTAVVAVLRDNKDLYVANAGDSRCVVCREGKAIDMSIDHKPEDEEERNRIENAGGKVTSDGRVNNGLNLSRAIGDHSYKANKDLPLSKQMITSLPDVKHLEIDPSKDSFMILACDGIWNFMTSQEVCDYIQERIDAKYAKLSQICEELFMHCLAPDSNGDGTGCDNMTCIIVTFNPFRKFEFNINKTNGEHEKSLKRSFDMNSSAKSEETLTKKLKPEDDVADEPSSTTTTQAPSA